MAVGVDTESARGLLLQAVMERDINPLQGVPRKRRLIVRNGIVNEDDLRSILHGRHLTFKYILMTALLAKCTNRKVNAHSLQANWEQEGAYDARSLCHKVIVPAERDLLSNRLGGSNEPFLNKPARYPSVDLDNPVRGEKDAKLLKLLHDILSHLNGNPEFVFESLKVAMRVIFELESRLDVQFELVDPDINTSDVIDVFMNIMESSCEGQIAVITFGAIMKVKFPNHNVKCHPVNQPGSSSNEIGDIDFIKDDVVVMCAEVKVKVYTVHDVQHAAVRSLEGGCGKLLVVEGPRGRNSSSEGEIESLVNEFSSLGLDLITVSMDRNWIESQLKVMTFNKLLDSLTFLRALLDELRASDDARNWIKEVLERHGHQIRANN